MKREFVVVPAGRRWPCHVCEAHPEPGAAPRRASEREWACVETQRELLYVCLECGNTERRAR